jgi:hypothetical protein
LWGIKKWNGEEILKDFQKLTWPSRWINILLTVSVLAYLYCLPRVGDAFGYPETFQEMLPFVFLWVGTHFSISWASATHAWNGLIATTDSAVKPLGWDEDRKTEHEQRFDSFMGMIWGTRLTFLIASAIVAIPLAFSAFGLLTGGFQSEWTALQRQLAALMVLSPGLFGFTSWVFLNSRMVQYQEKILPVIQKAQLKEYGRYE